MGDIAVNVEFAEIGVLDQPRVGSVDCRVGSVDRVGSDPLEGDPGVVVGGRKWVFQGELVLDRDGEDLGSGDEAAQIAVVEEGEGGFDAEAAAMEVDQNRKLLLTAALVLGFVKAC